MISHIWYSQKECIKSARGNFILSPFSISNALLLLSQAANGNTYEELANGMHLNGDKYTIAQQFYQHYQKLQNGAGNTNLAIANKIFVQQGYTINQNIRQTAIQLFASDIEPVNFFNKNATAHKINMFVAEKTNKRITNLIKPDSLSTESRVVLVNAIHFKGDWVEKFNEDSTRNSKFYISETETVPAQLMYNDEWYEYADLPELDATALQMKYAKSNFSMVFVLPNSRTGLAALEARLNERELISITSRLTAQKLEAWIPKFTIEYETSLNDVLKNVCICAMHIVRFYFCFTFLNVACVFFPLLFQLNIKNIFESNANLSNLLETDESIHVGDVVHKAFIKVHEGGSEAAASTGIIFVDIFLFFSLY